MPEPEGASVSSSSKSKGTKKKRTAVGKAKGNKKRDKGHKGREPAKDTKKKGVASRNKKREILRQRKQRRAHDTPAGLSRKGPSDISLDKTPSPRRKQGKLLELTSEEKKKAHMVYMRFFQSVRSNKCPVPVKEAF